MATRRASARVKLNRKAVDQVQLAIGDGLNKVGEYIIMNGHPPDAAPFGIGLVRKGGWLVYIGDKKIAGGGTDGRQPKKPRAMRVRGTSAVRALLGWGFPSRFQEFGTSKMAPNPFFAADRDRAIPQIPSIMAKAAKYRIAKINGGRRA